MKKSELKTVGINLQRLNNKDDLKILEFKDLELKDNGNFLINSGAFYEIIVYNNLKYFEVKSSILKSIENTVEFLSDLKQIICSEQNCYFLQSDGQILHYDVQSKVMLNLCNQVKLKSNNEIILQISSTLKSLFAFSNKNRLYQILPNMILMHEFNTHQKIHKLESGLEHTLILTKNGDVYAFGCSLRGQTGFGTLGIDDTIRLIDALAGIKIIDIGCNAFSSIAVSSFGDVYSFGWNRNGQLGIEKSSDRSKQVYPLPELVRDLQDVEICTVFSGRNHTVLKTESNKLLVSGLNNYGQLGINNNNINEIDKFKEIFVDNISKETIVVCGYFATYLINEIKLSSI